MFQIHKTLNPAVMLAPELVSEGLPTTPGFHIMSGGVSRCGNLQTLNSVVGTDVFFFLVVGVTSTCQEKFVVDTLQPVNSYWRDEAGERLTHHVAVDRGRC